MDPNLVNQSVEESLCTGDLHEGAIFALNSVRTGTVVEHLREVASGKFGDDLKGKAYEIIWQMGITAEPDESKGALLAVLTLGKASIELLLIPAGRFVMGSPKGEGDNDERPQHPLDLPDYYIARTPTTNAQFARFIQDGGYRRREFWTEAGWQAKEIGGWTQPRLWTDEKWNSPDFPVVGVSWYEALAYARWAGGALPSEAEWEKAASWDARAGRQRRYPWGDEWDAGRCNSREKGPGRTTPVGQYSPQGDSAYGCADMAGNVWEWCRSLFKPYPYDAADGREDVAAEGGRVVRGGSWRDYQDYTRCASRLWYLPDDVWHYFGFRVCVSPISPISAL